MQQWEEALELAKKATRCTARNRRGLICKSPAMTNGKCRMHGGASTGAPCGEKHGRYKHGRFTKESLEWYAEIKDLMLDSKKIMCEIDEY